MILMLIMLLGSFDFCSLGQATGIEDTTHLYHISFILWIVLRFLPVFRVKYSAYVLCHVLLK